MTSTYPAAPPLHHKFFTVEIPDLSAATSSWVVPGFRGKIRKIHTVIDGAITTLDAGITVEIGGVAVTGGAITIANASSAAGDVDTATPSALNTFTPGQPIEVICDGAATGTVKAVATLELEPV